MTKIKISAAAVLLVTSLSSVSAMDMMDKMATSTQDMKNTMKAEGMSDTSMYDMVHSTSKKTDITKLQMMLVDKGYLIMPHGATYGYYGNLTTKAFAKYKKASMMMHSETSNNGDTMQGTGTMMSH